jgi:hypothetical protein
MFHTHTEHTVELFYIHLHFTVFWKVDITTVLNRIVGGILRICSSPDLIMNLISVIVHRYMIYYIWLYNEQVAHFGFVSCSYLGGLVVSVLATGPKVRGFKPSRGRWILSCDKIRSMPSFRGEVKLSVPCHRFTACKRTLRVWKKFFVGKIQRPRFSPASLLDVWWPNQGN